MIFSRYIPCSNLGLQGQFALISNKGRFCNNSEIDTLISKRLSAESKAKLSQLTRADCNNSEIDILISKRLSIKNKEKLSQFEVVNKQYCWGGVLSFQLQEFHFVLYSNRFETSVSISILLQNLSLFSYPWCYKSNET